MHLKTESATPRSHHKNHPHKLPPHRHNVVVCCTVQDGRQSPPRELPLGDGTGKIGALKARAVLIDMEEGVINSLLTGPMREVFDPMLKVSSVVLLPSPSAVEGHSFGPNPPTPHREPMPHMPHASSHHSYVGHFLHGARGV